MAVSEARSALATDKPLTGMQRIFVERMLVHEHPVRAAKEAGFSQPHVKCSALLNPKKYPHVVKALEEGRLERRQKSYIKSQHVVHELSNIAFSNIKQLLDRRGELQDLKDIPEDVAAAIASMNVEYVQYYEARPRDEEDDEDDDDEDDNCPRAGRDPEDDDDDSRDADEENPDREPDTGEFDSDRPKKKKKERIVRTRLKKISLKFWNKLEALEMLAKHLGLLKDQTHQTNVNVNFNWDAFAKQAAVQEVPDLVEARLMQASFAVLPAPPTEEKPDAQGV